MSQAVALLVPLAWLVPTVTVIRLLLAAVLYWLSWRKAIKLVEKGVSCHFAAEFGRAKFSVSVKAPRIDLQAPVRKRRLQ